MRALLDINILIALFDPDHVFHDPAHRWLETHAAGGIATCPLTENGMVRILSLSGYSAKVRFHPGDLIARLHRFTQSHNHEFWPDSLSLRDPKCFERGRILGSRQITDLYLLSLAVAHSGKLVTFDTGIPLNAVPSATPENLEVI